MTIPAALIAHQGGSVMYVFARDGKTPEGFSASQLKEAMQRL